MTTSAPLNLRLALFHLQCQAKEQLAEYQERLVRASSIEEAGVCRAAIKRLRAAILASELGTHVGGVQ